MPRAPHDNDDELRDLEPREARFVDEYLLDLNGTQAAIRAGYAVTGARVTASRMLAKPNIQAHIAAARARMAQKAELTRDMIVEELRAIAFGRITDVMAWMGETVTAEEINEDDDGDRVRKVINVHSNSVILRNSADLPPRVAAAVQSVSQDAQGNVKIKMHDKRAALVDLGKHLGMFNDELTIKITTADPDELTDAELADIARAGGPRLIGSSSSKGKPARLLGSDRSAGKAKRPARRAS